MFKRGTSFIAYSVALHFQKSPDRKIQAPDHSGPAVQQTMITKSLLRTLSCICIRTNQAYSGISIILIIYQFFDIVAIFAFRNILIILVHSLNHRFYTVLDLHYRSYGKVHNIIQNWIILTPSSTPWNGLVVRFPRHI